MQKTTHASILIWALFFSLFIVFAFVTISSKVYMAITQSGTMGQKIDSILSLPKAMQSNNTQTQLPGGFLLQKDTGDVFVLKNREKTEIRFQATNRSSILLNLEEGNAMVYKFLLFDPVSMSGAIVSSGLVSEKTSFFVDFTPSQNTGILYLENLGGYAKFSYLSTYGGINPYSQYQILQKIGGKYYTKTQYQKYNFTPGDFVGLDYGKYEMNF